MSILSRQDTSILLSTHDLDRTSPLVARFKDRGWPLTLPEAIDALSVLDPNLPRGEWVRLAASLHSEFGDEAMAAYDEWSQRGASYNARDFRSMWKSLRGLNQISIASLLFHAKAAGWVRTRRVNDANQLERSAPREPSPHEVRSGISPHRVTAWFESYSPARPDHPYLQRKQISAYRLREDHEGSLVVPLTDGKRMTGMQFIRPCGSKQYLRGTAKRGSFYPVWISAKTPRDAPCVGICEGVATGHSLFEHTLIPIYCAMDAGNLVAVAQALRKWYRDATLIFYADNDVRGTGERKAIEASLKVSGVAKIHMAPTVGSDWNDFVNSRKEAGEVASV